MLCRKNSSITMEINQVRGKVFFSLFWFFSAIHRLFVSFFVLISLSIFPPQHGTFSLRLDCFLHIVVVCRFQPHGEAWQEPERKVDPAWALVWWCSKMERHWSRNFEREIDDEILRFPWNFSILDQIHILFVLFSFDWDEFCGGGKKVIGNFLPHKMTAKSCKSPKTHLMQISEKWKSDFHSLFFAPTFALAIFMTWKPQQKKDNERRIFPRFSSLSSLSAWSLTIKKSS